MTELNSCSAEDTYFLGVCLGQLLAPNDFIALSGELGTGKTHFVKGVASGLGVSTTHPITSPTYNLLNVHEGRLSLYHFDLYRLRNEEQILDIGFEEHCFSGGVCIVEWAERLGDLMPEEGLFLFFSYFGEESRRIVVAPRGSRAEQLMQHLFDLYAEKSV